MCMKHRVCQDAIRLHKALFLHPQQFFHFIRMSEFFLFNGVTVVISATFGKTGLSFSVYNITKKTNILMMMYAGPFPKKVWVFSSHEAHLNVDWTKWKLIFTFIMRGHSLCGFLPPPSSLTSLQHKIM